MTVRVLIVEDHDLVRKGLLSLVSAMPNYEVVGEACDAQQAILAALALQPDLVLMDLSMPGMRGFDPGAQVRRRTSKVRMLALAISRNQEFVRDALRVCADGYIRKCASLDEFVLASNPERSDKMPMRLAADYIYADNPAAPRTMWEKLTVRERSILKLIAEGNTNRATAQYLSLSAKTVEKHRASLMRKLELRNATQLIMTAIDMGLIERGAGARQMRGASRLGLPQR
jgi:DNA-binding NarL/FixJ family response regulator